MDEDPREPAPPTDRGGSRPPLPRFPASFLERFDVGVELGAGGMGRVLAGRHRGLNRPVAIKFTLSLDADARARFAREGRAIAALRHPNLIQVFEAGEVDGCPFLVFEVVDGSTLEALVAREGKLAAPRALEIARQAASALACAHQQGILHRDLKSANILIASDGSIKVCDFGLARNISGDDRITISGALLGSPEYLAPEIVDGSEPGTASDLYSLGCVLMEMLTGTVPFPTAEGDDLAQSIADVVAAHVREDAPRVSSRVPGTPAAVDDLVARCLAKRPVDRPTSATELERELGALIRRLAIREQLVASPLSTAPALPTRRVGGSDAPSPPGRARLPAALLALGGVAIGVAATLALQSSASRPPAPLVASGTSGVRADGSPPGLDAREVARPSDSSASQSGAGGNARPTASIRRPGSSAPAPAQTPRPAPPPNAPASVRATRNSRGFDEAPNRDGSTLIRIPAGEFDRGQYDGESDAAPARRVFVSAFWIGKTEVTMGQFARFCREARQPLPPPPTWPGSDRHPIVRVSWDDAVRYAAWAGARLPTEVEWEFAARGPAASLYSWGAAHPTTAPPYRANFEQSSSSLDGFKFAAPVGSFGPDATPPRADGSSFCGALDLTGNVWEWCQDLHHESFYAFCPTKDPVNRILGERHIVRGGAYYNTKRKHLHAAYRHAFKPEARSEFVGFRIAR